MQLFSTLGVRMVRQNAPHRGIANPPCPVDFQILKVRGDFFPVVRDKHFGARLEE